ncbi:MAG: acyl-CoA dehydrogenase family protein, partial [Streptosporangiaceae bacterium]
MNFELNEVQRVIAASAADVLRGAEPQGGAAWHALAEAGLLSLTLPGWMGGDDLGVLEAALLLTEVGRRAVDVPALATIMLGALPVARWGGRELQERVLGGVGEGATILTAAVRERSSVLPPVPATVAKLDDAGSGTVTGIKVGVPYAAQARWILVPAAVANGGPSRAVIVVDGQGPGVAAAATPAAGSMPEYTVRLDAAPVAGVLGAETARDMTGRAAERVGAAFDDLYLLALAGAVAMADGAVAGALDLTATYIAGREQFGRPLATFQSVAGQAADIYVASRTLHLAATSACWRIAAGRDAGPDVDIAAYWLAKEAPAALRTCHQLHGGIGLDVGYPLHRYSAMVSDLVRFVGGADYQLGMIADRWSVLARGHELPEAVPAGAGASAACSGSSGMFIELTDDQVALREELQAYFAGLISPAEREAMRTDRHGAVYQRLIRR